MVINNFLIVGTGRIGSLSLADTLNVTPDIISTHEKFRDARVLSNTRWDSTITDEDLVSGVRKSYTTFKNQSGKIRVDSNCLVWNIIDVIDFIDDDVGYIYIVRNRQQTVDSMMRTGFYTTTYPWSLRAKKGFINPFHPTYTEEDRRKNAEYAYDIRNGQIQKSFKQIDERRILRLDFDDMLRDNKQYMGRIINFMKTLSGIQIVNKTNLLHKHKTN